MIVIVACIVGDFHGGFTGYVYVDLLQGTAVQVSSAETKTGPLPETGLWFWLDAMAAYDSAEGSEYHNVTLLEHAPPTAFTTHINPVFDDPTKVTTTPSSPYPKSVPATSPSVNFVERGCSSDFEGI